MDTGYINGFIERSVDGKYEGRITIEGISLPDISAQYFKKDGENYLWLKRKKVLEYNEKTMTYVQRNAMPLWECYLKKQIHDDTVAYEGEFTFMHFRFSIVGVWDKILGVEKQHRLNLYVERLPITQQTIINGINERKRNESQNGRTN